ncbi:MAG: nitroreductase [Bacteroidia bacterium]
MNKEQIASIIKSRKSTYPKQFSGEKIDNKTITEWLELSNWAPNHKLTEPWRFVVFTGEALINLVNEHKKIYLAKTPDEDIIDAKLAKFEIVKSRTSHILAVVCQLDEAKRLPEWEEVAATAMGVQNLYLALDVFNMAGYWSTGNTNTSEMRQFLSLTNSQVHLGWLYVGKPDKALPEGRRMRRPMENKIEWR